MTNVEEVELLVLAMMGVQKENRQAFWTERFKPKLLELFQKEKQEGRDETEQIKSMIIDIPSRRIGINNSRQFRITEHSDDVVTRRTYLFLTEEK
jgi:hypothetical protein